MVCCNTPPLGGCMGGWVGQWVGSCQISKSQIFCYLIEKIEFCLKIFDLWKHPHIWVSLWVDYCVGQWVGSCQITKISINRNLIEIIQFRLKIYDL